MLQIKKLSIKKHSKSQCNINSEGKTLKFPFPINFIGICSFVFLERAIKLDKSRNLWHSMVKLSIKILVFWKWPVIMFIMSSIKTNCWKLFTFLIAIINYNDIHIISWYTFLKVYKTLSVYGVQKNKNLENRITKEYLWDKYQVNIQNAY